MFFSGEVGADAMLVTSDVIIGVSGVLLLIGLCVVAIVVIRSLCIARRKRLHDRQARGACIRYATAAFMPNMIYLPTYFHSLFALQFLHALRWKINKKLSYR